MSQRDPCPSGQVLPSWTKSEAPPCRDDGSGTPRNVNGKRPREELQEDGVETPGKLVRLDRDHASEREESRQPSKAIASTSDSKREQGFVDGPGHIVFIEERDKRCPALCFDEALLKTINRVAVISREVEKRDNEILMARFELEKVRSANKSAGIDKAARMVEEAIRSQKDIEAGIPELVQAQQRYDGLAEQNQWSRLTLQSNRVISQRAIEQMLEKENLLEIPSPKPQVPVEDSTEQSSEPAPAPVPEIGEHDTEKSDAPRSKPGPSSTGSQSSTDSGERISPRQLALRRFRWAADELDRCRRRFAFMQERYAHDVAANRRYRQERYPGRAASIAQTELDLQILQKQQRATRLLIEAEDAYDGAERHVEALGLGDILADPQAYYRGEVYDDFPPRSPQGPSMSPTLAADRPRIEAWMASVPGPAEVDAQGREEAGPVEGGDWDARSVDVFESVSVVAGGLDRRKIAEWRELSGRFRRDGAVGAWPGAVRRNPRRSCRGRTSPGERSSHPAVR